MRLRIDPLDAADSRQMSAWYVVYDAASRHGVPYPVPLQLEELRAQLLAADTGERLLGFTGVEDVTGEVVCAGRVELPMRDNLHLARLEVFTHPRHRGAGAGGTMLGRLEQVARGHGRSTAEAEAFLPPDAPADGRGHPNADFLLGHGYRFVLGDVMRLLELPADDRRLATLARDAADHHGGYRLRTFRDPVPEDLVEAFGALIGRLMTEAPAGERDVVEAEVFDLQRIRADEEVLRASGREKYTTVAVAPDGTLAAYSEIAVPSLDPGRCFQWGTLVVPEHRGHRLGLATKVANLLRVQEQRPDLRELVTFNAEANAHMVAVNEMLGFRPVQRLAEYDKPL